MVLQGTLETSWGNTTILASTGKGLESSHTQARLATVTPAGRENSMSADEKPEEKEEEEL